MKYMIWRYPDQRPADGDFIDVLGDLDHESAASTWHEHMASSGDSPGDNVTVFVQAVEGDRKVRVVHSELRMEPTAYAHEKSGASLKARCRNCRRRQLDDDALFVGRQCRACGYKEWRKKGACA